MRHVVDKLGVSLRAACSTIGISRSYMNYKSKRLELDSALIIELHAMKTKYPRWGYKKIHRLLVNEGWKVNHKRIQRLWRQEGLAVARQVRAKKRAPGSKENACDVRCSTAVNHVWSIDFVSDQTEEGRRLKMLTVVDEYSREALAIEVTRKMDNQGVQKVLGKLIAQRGRPGFVRSDNGSEFIAKALQKTLGALGVENAYIAPGSPWQNGKNERFNGILRQELLARELFYSLKEARVMVESFRRQYNNLRPHGALSMMTPTAFALQQSLAGAWFQVTV